MRGISCLTILVILLGVGADAQTLTVENLNAARASIRAGYGGHGPDWDISLESPKLAGALRVRAGVGHGSWVGINQDRTGPDVTRLSAMALLYLRPREVTDDLYMYVGLGLVAIRPDRSDMSGQTGKRIVFGIEGTIGRWTFGPEVELDVPSYGAIAGDDLTPALRGGIALRRRF